MSTRLRKTGAERAEEIARTTLRIIGEEGAAAFTTTAVARAIGVTSGALFRHFTSRDDILLATVRYAAQRIDATYPERSLPAAERLGAFAKKRVQLLGSEPGIMWLLRSEQALPMLPADAVDVLQGVIERSRRFIRDALRDGVAEGTVRDDVAPEALQVIVMGTIHALLGMSGGRGSRKPSRGPARSRVLTGLMRVIAPVNDVTMTTDSTTRRRRKSQ